MSDYEASGNRYTAIFVKIGKSQGNKPLLKRAPYELVRFNVDDDPDAEQYIIPVGLQHVQKDGTNPNSEKIYEDIKVYDEVPFKAKTFFGDGEF